MGYSKKKRSVCATSTGTSGADSVMIQSKGSACVFLFLDVAACVKGRKAEQTDRGSQGHRNPNCGGYDKSTTWQSGTETGGNVMSDTNGSPCTEQDQESPFEDL